MEESILLEEFGRLREEVFALASTLSVPVLALRFKAAARALGLKNARTISRMVAKGAICSVMISGVEMIPMSELRRITTPKLPARAVKRAARVESPADEAQRTRELLKRR